jgi:hypothetical protein
MDSCSRGTGGHLQQSNKSEDRYRMIFLDVEIEGVGVTQAITGPYSRVSSAPDLGNQGLTEAVCVVTSLLCLFRVESGEERDQRTGAETYLYP